MILLLFAAGLSSTGHAQKTTVDSNGMTPTVDVTDVLKKIFKKQTDSSKAPKKSPVAILPSLSYNPSMGFVIGAKASAGLQKGNPENTNYSIIGLEAIYSTKGIITLQARHNIFTAENKWNFQGNWQLSKFGMVDYGLGTGNSEYQTSSFVINDYPTENGDSAFPVKYGYLRLLEKVYRKIGSHLYVGGGVSFEIFSNIEDEKATSSYATPHQRYSDRHGFDPDRYSANGLMANIQYNTREHPTRSYGGFYADVSFQFNQKWMGSTKNAIQAYYDLRKYWSLSKRNPEHVIAVWTWASYTLSGEQPYLALPYTASDTYNRSGRGYTLGRFKGPSFSYFETEYRFPITRNKLISGVCFINMQSASDDFDKKIYESWEPGGGAGLRILFQKESRTTICIDFGQGKYGSSGIFFGLNEVF